MRKIAILCLALVMALGSLGVAYAAWSETLTIEGTVDTGAVDFAIVGYSETHVYKTPNHGTVGVYELTTWGYGSWHAVITYPLPDPPVPPTLVSGPHPLPGGWELIASATVEPFAWGAKSVAVTYEDLFPGPGFAVDLLVNITGTVPTKINDVAWTTTGHDYWLQALVDAGYANDVAFRITFEGLAEVPTPGDLVDIGTQLHPDDYVMVVLGVILPPEAPQGASGTFTYTVEIVQWNLYPYP